MPLIGKRSTHVTAIILITLIIGVSLSILIFRGQLFSGLRPTPIIYTHKNNLYDWNVIAPTQGPLSGSVTFQANLQYGTWGHEIWVAIKSDQNQYGWWQMPAELEVSATTTTAKRIWIGENSYWTFTLTLDLSTIPNGQYQLVFELRDYFGVIVDEVTSTPVTIL